MCRFADLSTIPLFAIITHCTPNEMLRKGFQCEFRLYVFCAHSFFFSAGLAYVVSINFYLIRIQISLLAQIDIYISLPLHAPSMQCSSSSSTSPSTVNNTSATEFSFPSAEKKNEKEEKINTAAGVLNIAISDQFSMYTLMCIRLRLRSV